MSLNTKISFQDEINKAIIYVFPENGIINVQLDPGGVIENKTIQVGLLDNYKQITDDIRIVYHFDRMGWSVEQNAPILHKEENCNDLSRGQYWKRNDDWKEVAFIRSFQRMIVEEE